MKDIEAIEILKSKVQDFENRLGNEVTTLENEAIETLILSYELLGNEFNKTIYKKDTYNMCSLCLKTVGNDNLIWSDGLQMCEHCHDRYIENDYNKQCMQINSIKKYRKILNGEIE